MSPFDPGPLADATVDGPTLVFVRDLRHPPQKVWTALTDPERLDRWAPFAAARPLDATGDTTLTMIDGDTRMDMPATVRRAEAPTLLEYTWGDDLLRWELEPTATGTRLTLRHTLAQPDMTAMVAAGWHICLVVAEHLLDGDPIGVIRGSDAMNYGWEKLRDAYAEKFGIASDLPRPGR
jgi:uncharacterized protein YndB with AHSA1/START domain